VDYKYIVADGNSFTPRNTRPTQAEVKTWGMGEYRLLRGDASVAKTFTVVKNRNGNMTVTATPPGTLEGLSEIRLNRLARALANVVKLWPEKSRDLDKVNKIIAERQKLITNIDGLFEQMDWKPAIKEASA